MVEVFKTNVQQRETANRLIEDLMLCFPAANRINFDLHDCDNILRIEGESIAAWQVISIMNACGYQAEIL